ncbi:unannotated protein [freshwater metagenome]|uniref:Unannotated protein n=1 Tax=freshwater metagenome TaxID=449393 RepID=A0A6J6P832_9ZZZZ
MIPQANEREEVRTVLARKPLVGCGGSLQFLGRPLARVLDGQHGSNDHHFARTAKPVRLEHHAAEPRVNGKPSESLAEAGEVA